MKNKTQDSSESLADKKKKFNVALNKQIRDRMLSERTKSRMVKDGLESGLERTLARDIADAQDAAELEYKPDYSPLPDTSTATNGAGAVEDEENALLDQLKTLRLVKAEKARIAALPRIESPGAPLSVQITVAGLYNSFGHENPTVSAILTLACVMLENNRSTIRTLLKNTQIHESNDTSNDQ